MQASETYITFHFIAIFRAFAYRSYKHIAYICIFLALPALQQQLEQEYRQMWTFEANIHKYIDVRLQQLDALNQFDEHISRVS